MKIEKAVIDDVKRILEIQKLAFSIQTKIYNDYKLPPLVQTIEELEIYFENYVFLKAVEDNEIIGSVKGKLDEDDTCHIGRLIVHPDFHNKGIGAILMNGIEKYFDGAKRYELFTGFRSEKNLYLFKKMGYNEFKTEMMTDRIKVVFMEKYNRTNN